MALDEEKSCGDFANNSDDDRIPGRYGRQATEPMMKSSAKWQGKYVHTWHSFLQGGWEMPKAGYVAWITPYKCTHWGFFSGKGQELVLCQLQEAATPKCWLLCWVSLFSLLPVEPRSFCCGKCSSLAGMSGFSSLFFQFSSVLLNEQSLMYDRANQLLTDSFYIWKDYNLFALLLS